MLEISPFCLSKNGKPFHFEFILDTSCHLLTLPATISNDLRWEKPLEALTKFSALGQKVLLRLDLGLETYFSEDHELFFQSAFLAIEEMQKKVLAPFKEIIEGVILYQGSCFFERSAPLEETLVQERVDPALACIYEPIELNRLASAAILGSVFHRLIAFIPEEVPCFAIFENAGLLNGIDRAILFSKERFEHLFLVFYNPYFQYPMLDLNQGMSSLGYMGIRKQDVLARVSIGLLLPADSSFSQEGYYELKQFMERLELGKVAYRLIPERLCNESWNDLDTLIYQENCLQPMTKRMLQGFIASGGTALDLKRFSF